MKSKVRSMLSLFLLLLLISTSALANSGIKLEVIGYGLATDLLQLDSFITGYQDTAELYPKATVHVRNQSNRTVKILPPTASLFHVGSIDKTTIEPDEYAVFTIMLKEGHTPENGISGIISETISVYEDMGNGTAGNQPLSSLKVQANIYQSPYFVKSTTDLTPISSLDFGVAEFGFNADDYQREIALYNPSDVDLILHPEHSYYEFELTNFDYMTELPARTAIPITLKPNPNLFDEPEVITTQLSTSFDFSSRHGILISPHIKLPLSFEVKKASDALVQKLYPDSIEFGRIYEGENRTSFIVLRNLGSKSAVISQPISQYFEFAQVGTFRIEPDQTLTIQLRPKANLAKGFYTEDVTIPVGNNKTITVNASCEITEGTFKLQLENSVLTLKPAYEQAFTTPARIKITNIGTAKGSLSASNGMFGDFVVNLEKDELEPGESTDVIVDMWHTAYHPGEYSTVITITGENNASASFTANFERLEGRGDSSFFITPVQPGFGSVQTKNPVKTYQDMAIVNQTNESISIRIPELQHFKITGLNKTTIEPNGRATFRLTPRNDGALGLNSEDLQIFDLDGNLLIKEHIYFYLESADYKVTYAHHPHCHFETIDVDRYQGPYFPHGALFRFRVVFDQHYAPGEDFVVKYNGKPIEMNPSTHIYAINSVEEDFKLSVDGVIYKLHYPQVSVKDENAFTARLDGNSTLPLAQMLTAEEEEQIRNGQTYSVSLEVEDISDSVDSHEKDAIISSSNPNAVISEYMDITLTKKIGDDETVITNLDGSITITIVVPEELRSSLESHERIFGIIRYHDGKAENIYGDYDKETGILSFQTDRFSTYALYYEDVPVALPATGDHSHIWLYAALLTASLLGLSIIAKKERTS